MSNQDYDNDVEELQETIMKHTGAWLSRIPIVDDYNENIGLDDVDL